CPLMNDNNNMPARFIAVTENYGLVPEDTCFVLWRMATVDPRKAPGYSGDMSDAVIRNEWRDAKKYYNLTPAGLRNALREIAVKEAVAATDEQTDIGQFISAISSYVER